ncbi:MAG: hypothetical protein IPH62_00230 [Ignavibacteriae bacterium]|nr:hypothetical protein [Ignavibacteriota bacterium]
MDIRLYHGNCKSQYNELHKILNKNEKIEAQEHIFSLDKTELDKWYEYNCEEVKEFILSTPSERSKKKKWNTNKNQKYLLIYVSSIIVERAIKYFKVLIDNEIYGLESYREMTLKAGEIFHNIKGEKINSKEIFSENSKY